MSDAYNLCRVSTVQSTDLAMLWSVNSSQLRAAPMSVVLAYMQANLTVGNEKTTQYAAPTATAFSVLIVQPSTWLILTPTGTLAAGTITLPASPSDKSELLCNSTQIVTALTIATNLGANGANASIVGAPTTITAGGKFRMRYDLVTNTWYGV